MQTENQRRDVSVGIVVVGHLRPLASQVVKRSSDIRKVAAHVELQGFLPRGSQKHFAVVTRLSDRRRKVGGSVKRAERTICKTAANRVQMSKRRHVDGAARSERAGGARGGRGGAGGGPRARGGGGGEPV